MKSSANLLMVAGALVLIAELSVAHYGYHVRNHRYVRCWRPSRPVRPPTYPVPPPIYPVRPPIYPIYPIYPVPPPISTAPPVTPAPTTPPVPTTTPVVIPPDVLNLFNSLASLPLLLYLNMLANTLPPVTPPGNGANNEIPVPLARLHPRSLDNGQPGDECKDWELSEDSEDLLSELRSGVTNTRNVREYLTTVDVCELKKIAESLGEFEKGRKIVEKFMLAPDSKAETRIGVYVEFILAVARQKSEVSALRSRRQYTYRYPTSYYRPAPQPSISISQIYALLQRYGPAYVRQNPQMAQLIVRYYPQLAHLFWPTTQAPPPQQTPVADDHENNQVVHSVLDSVLPTLGIDGNSSEIFNSVLIADSRSDQFTNAYYTLIRATRFKDHEAACELLYRYSFSQTYALRVMAAIAFNRFGCSVPTYPPIYTTAAPTTVRPTAPPTTTTTPRPSANCGQSTKLDRLNGVSTEPFFITSRIVGGNVAGSCTLLPWQVRLNVTGKYLCGGSIIDSTHILTAAHCIPADRQGTIEVTAGDYNIDYTESTEQNRAVAVLSDVDVHPDYIEHSSGTMSNDIAVITLKEPLDMSHPCVEPICLKRTSDYNGQSCTVSGWGRLEEDGALPSKLQYANVDTYLGTDCRSTFDIPYYNYVADPSTQLCAGFKQGGIDSCQGDSGGPLVCRDNTTNSYYQAGVVSYGNGCANANFPGIYTDVSAYYDWIRGKL